MFHWPTPPTAPSPSPALLEAPRFALPDGTPLTLTMTRKSLYCSLTGAFGVGSLEHALLLLFLCRPQFNTRARWVAPAPSDAPEPDLRREQPDYWTALRLEADAWADTLPHTWFDDAISLAVDLWTDTHATAVEPVTPAAEKKTDACPTGQSPPPPCWPAAAWDPATTSSTSAPCGTSTPASTLGTWPTASPASLPPSAGSGSPPPGASAAPPSDASAETPPSGERVPWLARARLVNVAAPQYAVTGAPDWRVTTDAAKALPFSSEEDCAAWIGENVHMFTPTLAPFPPDSTPADS